MSGSNDFMVEVGMSEGLQAFDSFFGVDLQAALDQGY